VALALAGCFTDPSLDTSTSTGSSDTGRQDESSDSSRPDDSATTSSDEVGSSEDGTSSSGDPTTSDAETTSDVVDAWALGFDGDDFAITTAVPEATLPSEFTVELWLRVEAQPYHGILIDTRPPGTNVTEGWVLFIGPPTYSIPNRLVIGWFAEDGTAPGLEGPEVHELSRGWHHLAVTREADGTARMFVDGVESASGPTDLPPAPRTAELAVGRYRNGSPAGGLWWTGAPIDDLHISRVARYADAFTPSSAEADADSVLLWRFDEGNGSVATDDVAGVELTLDGATWVPRE
jgi:hypothetical protein